MVVVVMVVEEEEEEGTREKRRGNDQFYPASYYREPIREDGVKSIYG